MIGYILFGKYDGFEVFSDLENAGDFARSYSDNDLAALIQLPVNSLKIYPGYPIWFIKVAGPYLLLIQYEYSVDKYNRRAYYAGGLILRKGFQEKDSGFIVDSLQKLASEAKQRIEQRSQGLNIDKKQLAIQNLELLPAIPMADQTELGLGFVNGEQSGGIDSIEKLLHCFYILGFNLCEGIYYSDKSDSLESSSEINLIKGDVLLKNLQGRIKNIQDFVKNKYNNISQEVDSYEIKRLTRKINSWNYLGGLLHQDTQDQIAGYEELAEKRIEELKEIERLEELRSTFKEFYRSLYQRILACRSTKCLGDTEGDIKRFDINIYDEIRDEIEDDWLNLIESSKIMNKALSYTEDLIENTKPENYTSKEDIFIDILNQYSFAFKYLLDKDINPTLVIQIEEIRDSTTDSLKQDMADIKRELEERRKRLEIRKKQLEEQKRKEKEQLKKAEEEYREQARREFAVREVREAKQKREKEKEDRKKTEIIRKKIKEENTGRPKTSIGSKEQEEQGSDEKAEFKRPSINIENKNTKKPKVDSLPTKGNWFNKFFGKDSSDSDRKPETGSTGSSKSAAKKKEPRKKISEEQQSKQGNEQKGNNNKWIVIIIALFVLSAVIVLWKTGSIAFDIGVQPVETEDPIDGANEDNYNSNNENSEDLEYKISDINDYINGVYSKIKKIENFEKKYNSGNALEEIKSLFKENPSVKEFVSIYDKDKLNNFREKLQSDQSNHEVLLNKIWEIKNYYPYSGLNEDKYIEQTYQVKGGDNWPKISRKFGGIDIDVIKYYSPVEAYNLKKESWLSKGVKLVICQKRN